MLLIGFDKLLLQNCLSQAFESLRSIVFDRLEHHFFCVLQAISFFSAGERLKFLNRGLEELELGPESNPLQMSYFERFQIQIFL
jgi:hypothetical protein